MPYSPAPNRRAQSMMIRGLIISLLIITLVPLSTGAQVAQPTVVVPTNQLAAGLYPPTQWQAADHIRAVNDASGRNLSLSGLWLNINEPTNNIIYQLEQVWSAGATPFVNIHVDWPPARILDGFIDSEIASFGSAVGQWLSSGGGRAVLLAPMPEMNGDWVPYGMDPTNFAGAYRHFITVAAQNGTSGRVRWVFAPNGWSTPPHQMADYYPGADVVDFVGFSAYNWGPGQTGFRWTSASETLCAPLNEARSFAREKPFLVAQTASTTTGGNRGTWIASMFQFLTEDPNAVGFLYFDIDKERDWAIYENGTVPAQWQQGMQSPQTEYQHPLENWFAPGQLEVDSVHEIYPGCIADIEGSQFQPEIKWLVSSGITVGCATNYFCPKAGVTRGQMASFLVRSLGLGPGSTDFFADDNGSIHEADINAMAQAGITTGCGVGTFCPGINMTRGQMASFLTRGFALPGSTVDRFSDDAGSVHEADINSVAQAGITLGCGSTSFCPVGTVTREQMAAFLFRALG